MSANLAPGDPARHGDKQLITDLVALDEQISHYVLRFLNADAGRAAPVSVADVRAFAELLQAMADRMQERAQRHAASSTPAPPDGSFARHRLTNRRQSER